MSKVIFVGAAGLIAFLVALPLRAELVDRSSLDNLRAEQLTGAWEAVQRDGKAGASGFVEDYDGNRDGLIDKRESVNIETFLLSRTLDMASRGEKVPVSGPAEKFDQNGDGMIDKSEARSIREDLQ